MTNERDRDTLGGRIAASEQLSDAWARSDDDYDGLRATSAALTRAETKSAVAELQARFYSQAHSLRSSLSIVETMTLRLAAERGPGGTAMLMASIGSNLAAAWDLQQGIREIEDLELRRLVGAFGDHLKRARLAFSELERYYGRVYGERDKEGAPDDQERRS